MQLLNLSILPWNHIRSFLRPHWYIFQNLRWHHHIINWTTYLYESNLGFPKLPNPSTLNSIYVKSWQTVDHRPIPAQQPLFVNQVLLEDSHIRLHTICGWQSRVSETDHIGVQSQKYCLTYRKYFPNPHLYTHNSQIIFRLTLPT